MPKPDLVEHQILKVLKDEKYTAQRYALAGLLTAGEGGSDSLFAAAPLKKSMSYLVRAWRSRVVELRKAGWSAASGVHFTKLSNCPPPAVRTRAFVRPCHHYNVCPFCWSREVAAEVFRRASHSLHQQKLANLYELIEYRYLPMATAGAEAAVADALFRMAELREFARWTLGACSLATVDVAKSELGAVDWRIQNRFLAVLSCNECDKLPKPVGDSPEHRALFKWGPVSSDELAASVGRVAAYPTGFITGPIQATMSIIEARSASIGRQPRLLTFYGSMRYTKEDKRNANTKRKPGRVAGGKAKRAGKEA